MKEVVLRVAAKAVIINDSSEILILREAAYDEGTRLGLWGIPGGRINSDESFFDGLHREVKEETGLKDVKIGDPVSVGEWWRPIHGVDNHIVAMFMLCRTKSTAVKLSDEHDRFVWLQPGDIEKYDFMQPDDEILKKVFKEIAK